MSKQFIQVSEFNRMVLKFPKPKKPQLLEHKDAEITCIALEEEAQEFNEAHVNGDLIGCVDACIDSIYFAMGALYKMGISEEQFEECFSLVHLANMKKMIGQKESRIVGGQPLDAVKPKDWVSPEYAIAEKLGLDK